MKRWELLELFNTSWAEVSFLHGFWDLWSRSGDSLRFDRDFVFGKYLTIIGRVWTKYGDLSVVSRSIIIIYLLICETLTKSRYFWISEFNNCFLIRSPSLFLNEYLREAKRSAIFHARVIAKHTTQLDDTAHKQNIICRQLFCRSRGGLSTNEKDEKLVTNDNITCVPPESEIPRDISYPGNPGWMYQKKNVGVKIHICYSHLRFWRP